MVVALLLLAGAVVFVWRILHSKNIASLSGQNDTQTNTQQLQKNIQARQEATTALKNVASVDADFDGITDADETAKYHTNPQAADTDADGLLDKDEIELYRSDPLKSDTDGDTHLDGDEVRSGYSPIGPGKLVPLTQ